MKILLVFPSILNEKTMPVKFKKVLMPPLTLAVLDALTPVRHSVTILDDLTDDIVFSDQYDLVGITAMTFQAPRAYQIADGFRAKGVKVILGGVHISAMPEEAKKHADSVAIGEVDDIWEQILDDCENNDLKEFYHSEYFPDLNNAVIPKWDNINMKNYVKQNGGPIIPLFTSRGCPMGCKFCSVTKFFGKTFRTKPISKVLQEIKQGKTYYYFTDDNVTFNVDYARELFKAIIKTDKKIKWASQVSSLILKNPDLIELAGKSGCMEMLLGLESINPDALKSVNKGFNKVERYEELIARLHKSGITAFPSLIVGFDEDIESDFELILEFLKKNRLARVIISILTPMPGTDLFTEWKEQGRIDDYDWNKYTGTHTVFKPKNFSKEELDQLRLKTLKRFYSTGGIIRKSWYAARDIKSGGALHQFFEALIYLYLYKTAYSSPLEGGIKPLKK